MTIRGMATCDRRPRGRMVAGTGNGAAPRERRGPDTRSKLMPAVSVGRGPGGVPRPRRSGRRATVGRAVRDQAGARRGGRRPPKRVEIARSRLIVRRAESGQRGDHLRRVRRAGALAEGSGALPNPERTDYKGSSIDAARGPLRRLTGEFGTRPLGWVERREAIEFAEAGPAVERSHRRGRCSTAPLTRSWSSVTRSAAGSRGPRPLRRATRRPRTSSTGCSTRATRSASTRRRCGR